ncbi:MAG: hypothetical protein KDD33_01060 [Bdellovibrionales bacterium]|nr:hypothetical protein [Bdellovibrionales bacterium]
MWHRWMAGGQLLQNNSFLMSASWHYMPSRKATRIYYGVGGAHKLISEKEFRSLFEWDQYYITGSIGLESLLSQTRGWRGEVKAYLASGDYAFHLLISYIWSL